MGFFTTDRWTNSILAIFIILSFAVILMLGFIGLGTVGVTWVYTQGQLWAKVVVSTVLLVLIGAVISFVRYIRSEATYDQEVVP